MKLGIIGGSGLDNLNLLENYEEKRVETPYGQPSSSITCGKIFGKDVCILARHGKKHEIPPSQVNYRANIAALAKLGCTHIIATTAVGSLREEIERGNYTRLGQTLTPKEFYDGPEECKVPSLDDRARNAKPAQTYTPDEWKKAFEERKKIFGSGFSIIEEIEDPSKKTGIKKVGH